MSAPGPRVALPWALGWLAAAGLGALNGTIRDLTYGRRLGESRAHQLSTGTLLLALGVHMSRLHRRWPIDSTAHAALVGLAWAGSTVAFEFGLGKVRGLSWAEMTADYDVTKGRTWIAVPLFLAVGPALVHRFQAPDRG